MNCVFLQLCTDALKNGWTKFKVKVGADLEDDRRRCRLVREMIGPSNTLVWLFLSPLLYLHWNSLGKFGIFFLFQMIDANQRWDVAEAISWVSGLAEFKPLWIEEPTSPDDILGHAAISKVRGKLDFPAMGQWIPDRGAKILHLFIVVCLYL